MDKPTQTTSMTRKKAIEILRELIYRHQDLNELWQDNQWNDALDLLIGENGEELTTLGQWKKDHEND